MPEFNVIEERIRIVAAMANYTAQIRTALAQIINIKRLYPRFTREYYDQLPVSSMNELGEWLLAANQADDNLVNRKVLFGKPSMSVQEIYKERLDDLLSVD